MAHNKIKPPETYATPDRVETRDRFHKMIISGDIESIKNESDNPFWKEWVSLSSGVNILSYAIASSSSVKIIETLLDIGVDHNHVSHNGKTVFHSFSGCSYEMISGITDVFIKRNLMTDEGIKFIREHSIKHGYFSLFKKLYDHYGVEPDIHEFKKMISKRRLRVNYDISNAKGQSEATYIFSWFISKIDKKDYTDESCSSLSLAAINNSNPVIAIEAIKLIWSEIKSPAKMQQKEQEDIILELLKKYDYNEFKVFINDMFENIWMPSESLWRSIEESVDNSSSFFQQFVYYKNQTEKYKENFEVMSANRMNVLISKNLIEQDFKPKNKIF